MENENLDLDVKPTGNKDLWLFLIIVDIVLLCVFGFFLYKHFSNYLFQITPQTVAEETATPAEPEQMAVVEETISIVQEPQEAAPVIAEEQVGVVAEIIASEEKAEKQPAEKVQAPVEKKESVIVTTNPKSKYRRVTFKWFGEGKKVQIVSGFTMSKPQSLTKKKGYWETTLSILPGTYKFLYIIDGENRQDPYSPQKDGRSVVVIK